MRFVLLPGNRVQGITSLGHLSELPQVILLKEKKNQATSNIFNNSNLFVDKTKQVVPPNKSESKNRAKHTLCWSPHKWYGLIHQIQFFMCTCFCLFACFIVSSNEENMQALRRTLRQFLIK